MKPRITPGFSVAGVILMISGTAYALVGIKTRWLHCFFSVGFLAAVGVTVLILYVMNPPISSGVQGAYVVAAVGTGALLGGASLIFQDILECLGCLLGGFCLSMWLLTLKAGGLIGSGGAGNVIFVCVFSTAGLIGYFSRWTRGYFMIACISFSGATAAVIGIDCFSRAGLKEFWAWIWNLNPNLFPLGANTYPLTRGIRVEQAATIIIFLAGIVSQSKLWMVIKERRAKKEEERRRGKAAMQEEEEHVGRDIESKNASERRDWDAVHDPPKSSMSVHSAYDSGMGAMENEKKHRNSGTTTTATRRSTAVGGDGIEMAEMSSRDEDEMRPAVPLTPKTAAEMVMGKDHVDGMVTVRVAVDEVDPPAAVDAAEVEGECEPAVQRLGDNDDAQLSTKPSADQLRPASGTPVPKVVPLPFKVPTIESENVVDDDDQSSVAAIPEYNYDDEVRETRSMESKRSSFAKRLSTGSADLLRRISHHSISRQLEKAAREARESTEDLTRPIRGDRDSVAATYDDASSAEDEDCGDSVDERPFSKELKPQLADRAVDERTEELTRVKEAVANKASRASLATVSTSILDVAQRDVQVTEPEYSTPQTGKPSAKDKGKDMETTPVDDEKEATLAISIFSEADSGPVGLTKDRLPSRLSKVALSYRTNEWAKHLSNAEAPALDDLNLPEPIVPADTPIEERSAPLNMEELQKTAETGALPPAMPRSSSVLSAPRASTRGPSNLEVPGSQLSSKTPPHSPKLGATSPRGHLSPNTRPPNSNSRWTSARAQVNAIVEEDNRKDSMSSETRQAAVQAAAAALVGDLVTRESPASSAESLDAVPAAGTLHSRPPIRGVVSYNSPQTLIGKRDMIMRVKNQALRPDSLRGSPVPQAPETDTDSIHTAYTIVPALGPPNVMRNSESLPGSRRNSGIYGRATISNSLPPNDNTDLDDLPLSQRRTIIRERRNSMASMNSSSNKLGGDSSRRSSFGYTTPVRANTNNSLGSNLSAPRSQRRSDIPPGHAGFRQAVQANLRSYSSIGIPAAQLNAQPGFGGGYQSNNMTPVAGPLINSVYGIPGTSASNSLLPQQTQVWDSEVQRDLDVQRQFLISQRDAETRRRESARVEREKGHKRFEMRMRTDSDLMEAHRDAMRRFQRKAT